MKSLLVICGAGHATSTIAVNRISDWLKKEKLEEKVNIKQSKIADELRNLDQYDAVVSTTVVPEGVRNKVINGLPLLTGMGADQVYTEIKERLEL